MNQKRWSTVLGLPIFLALIGGTPVWAYEIETHRLMTRRAFNESVLSRGYPEQELALSVSDRLLSSSGEALLPREWVEEGSAGEDSVAFVSPQPLRFRHHFYDPHFDRGLTVGILLGHRAFEWALEEPEEIAGQEFSWRDARRYFFDALTAGTSSQREAQMARTFRTLGHVIHLIQDMGSPEHTRNDMHLFGSLFEERIDEEREQFDFGGYPVPAFTERRQFWRTGDGRGFSEFTNRNFISEDTNFSRTEEGSTGGGYPLPRLNLSLREEVNIRALVPTSPLQGTVTFFGNDVDDRITGSVIRNSRMTSYSLFDRDLRRRLQNEVFTVNRFTIRRAGEILLPRAVGYSAGLLDYFFRGKLDLGFGANPSDATGSLITVANRSEEPLGPGTIELYADSLVGNRTKVAELAVGQIVRDQPLTAFPVSRDVEAQPLTAVFKGRLGQEPGAVIGKVGGRAVEQFFKGATDWMLRTADGIFPLGLGTAPGRVKWGDGDNLLLAQTFLPANDMQFQAYRINRSEGSSAVPLKANPLDPASQVVDLVSVGPPLRLGATPVDLGTTVHYRRTHNYRQHLLTFQVKEEVSVGEGAPVGLLTLERREVLSVEPTMPFAQAFAIDETFVPRTELPFFTTGRPYGWFVSDVFVSREGDVLALVQVSLNQRLLLVPVHAHDAQGAVGPTSSRRAVSLFSPSIQTLHFLVNLTQGMVVAKSSADVVNLTFTTEDEFTEVDAFITHFSADDEEQGSVWVYPYNFSLYAGTTQAGDPPVVATQPGAIGSSQWTLPGLHRPELVAAGFVDSFTVVRQDETTITKVPGGRKQTGAVAAIAFMTAVYDIPPPAPLGIMGVVRAGPDNRLALLGWIHTQNVERWVPYRWAPAQGTVTRLAGLDIPTDLPSDVSLLSANGESALLLASVTTEPLRILERTVRLVTEPREFTFLDRIDLRYRLLAPYWLFNVEDLRFHRVSAELEPLEGPRPLAGGGPTAGEYHVTGRNTP